MSDEAMKLRIKSAREAAGYKTRRAAADALGMPATTYYGYEDLGSHKAPSRDSVMRLSRKFKVSADWLLTGKTQPSSPNKAIAVVGIAGLGEEIEWHGDGDMDLGEVEVAGLAISEGLIALECRGDSMRPRVNDRELVIARRKDGKSPADLLGREAIVKIAGGPVLLKRIRRGYDSARFNLESYNADLRENVEIEWVAELVSIISEGAWRKA
jgi:transcriptional regulator with XRE-family HTH domain